VRACSLIAPREKLWRGHYRPVWDREMFKEVAGAPIHGAVTPGFEEVERTFRKNFPTTKGLAGMTVAVAHSRGLLDYDEKVPTYWPEFAHGGKENVTVRQLLSHQAGLSGLDKPLDFDTIATPTPSLRRSPDRSPRGSPGPDTDTMVSASAGMRANSSAASIPSIGAWVDSSRRK
jgi:Beta-lactamase